MLTLWRLTTETRVCNKPNCVPLLMRTELLFGQVSRLNCLFQNQNQNLLIRVTRVTRVIRVNRVNRVNRVDQRPKTPPEGQNQSLSCPLSQNQKSQQLMTSSTSYLLSQNQSPSLSCPLSLSLSCLLSLSLSCPLSQNQKSQQLMTSSTSYLLSQNCRLSQNQSLSCPLSQNQSLSCPLSQNQNLSRLLTQTSWRKLTGLCMEQSPPRSFWKVLKRSTCLVALMLKQKNC